MHHVLVAADTFESLVPAVAKASRVVPILGLRIVKTKSDALFLTGIGKLFHDVASKGSLIDNIEFIGFGSKHGESIVVLGGDDEIGHPSFFSPADKLISIESDGVKLRGVLFVFGNRNTPFVHHPLGAVGQFLAVVKPTCCRVHAPVNEHAELAFSPPLQPRVSFLFGFGHLL